MLEQYKVLNAMLALPEFTVRDLARYSDVKPTTVYTTISREKQYLEQIGRHETKKRGGQWLRWRVKLDQIPNLKARISEAFADMKVNPGTLDQYDSAPEVPTALLVAEDILVRRYPNTPPDKQRELLELAEINFNAAKNECEAMLSDSGDANVEAIHRQMRFVEDRLQTHIRSDSEDTNVQTMSFVEDTLQTHIRFCENLITLSEMEYDLIRSGDPRAEISVKELHMRLTNSCDELWKRGGDNQEVAFHGMQRVAHSPLINLALRY